MRNVYLNTLYELAQKDERIVSLVADNGVIIYDDFKKAFPERYFNFGISESNMVAASAGMASCGFIPYIYTISAFLAYRAYEFLRDDVCVQNQNVKIVGMGPGLTYSTLGPSHHTTEDIGLLRSIPNLTVFSPATREETKQIMRWSYEINGPVYIRLGNNNKEYYSNDFKFEFGVPAVVRPGKSVAIITTGLIVDVAVQAAELLSEEIGEVAVISVYTLKPINEKKFASLLGKYEKLVVLEEHNEICGLYSAISEVMVGQGVARPVLRIGLKDSFAEGYGTIDEVRRMNGLDTEAVLEKVRAFY